MIDDKKEDYKTEQRRLERRVKQFHAPDPKIVKPGNVLITPSGTKYLVTPQGWVRVKEEK